LLYPHSAPVRLMVTAQGLVWDAGEWSTRINKLVRDNGGFLYHSSFSVRMGCPRAM
jgi:hypothetical protein